MSVFVQSKGESIIINGDISVTVLDIFGDDVVLAIDAPEWMEIDGTEPNRSEDELEVSWSRFSDRKVPLNKVELDLVTQGIFLLSS